ncbi:type II toxin-antitoxin system RatA family toxin [Crossiella sp. CA198]|uniref:type II toxin-antitoxin system RatA family toxin n=1 Tax=Crossiella sp. CA198 TaxID=3455607 RepID=UPI003F8D88AC
MRHVEIHALIRDTDPDTVFDTLADFSHYAELVDVVRKVEMHRGDGGPSYSSWVVEFRNGLLQWTEQDWFRREEMRLDFIQTEGDFEEFYGGWVLEQTPEGIKTALIADFDFGVPSLASIVEPVAERLLTDVVQLVLIGLFGDRVEFPEGAPVPARAAAVPL